MFETELAKRVKKLEGLVADQQAVIALLLGEVGVKVVTEPEVYIPEKVVLRKIAKR